MKTIIRNITYVLLALLAVISCSDIREESQSAGKHVYKMCLEGGVEGAWTAETKSSHVWEDGNVIYLQFTKDSYLIQGTAVYSYEDDEWIVETDEELEETDEEGCEAWHFVGAESATALKVYLNDQTASYCDRLATYSLEGEKLTVRAYLTPHTSRIKFKGAPGAVVTLSGIKTFQTYNLTVNDFTEYTERKTITLDENGSSEYIHAVFTDPQKREIVFYDEGKRAFVRKFPENVLAVGTSGFLNVPTLDAMKGWTVVNVDNMEEVTLPVFGEVSILEIKSKSIKISAKVIDLGNGNLLKMGFICSTNSKPSFENGQDYPCDPSQDVLFRLRGLEPETRYYLRAYVINERGVTYGDQIRFVTISEEDEGASVHYDKYGEDENWGGESPSDGTDVGKDEYPEDENWGGNPPVDDDDFGKDDYPDDENWGGEPPVDDGMDKDGYPEDEDWN